MGDDYYIGKLAVDLALRGQGLAAALIDRAEEEARAKGLAALRLQTRVELHENHKAFRRMGFRLIGASAHAGYDQATSLTFRRTI
jgi:GNAT superfamily N-acetyltransferase